MAQKDKRVVEKRLKSGDYSITAPWSVMYLGNAMGLDMQPMYFDSEANMEVKEGMFLPLEIWLYVPGLGASRFEELVPVTKKGGEFLTKYRNEI